MHFGACAESVKLREFGDLKCVECLHADEVTGRGSRATRGWSRVEGRSLVATIVPVSAGGTDLTSADTIQRVEQT
jgi:hypothetical protein